MDMGASTATGMGSMSSMMPTMSSMSMQSSSTSMANSSMDMGSMSSMMGEDCKISMLWNWYTIDACFLAQSWHITSRGMFAGSCIGVICLVMVLEFLRRLTREYDAIIKRPKLQPAAPVNSCECYGSDTGSESAKTPAVDSGIKEPGRMVVASAGFIRPSIVQQAIRATIHMLTFAVAYFIMLLAMYYNGYILISIFIGAWLGSFFFSWDQLVVSNASNPLEVTGCCG